MGPDGALTALCWEPKCSKCRATGKFISELDRIKTLLCLWTLQEQVTVRVCFSDFFFVWGKVFFFVGGGGLFFLWKCPLHLSSVV